VDCSAPEGLALPEAARLDGFGEYACTLVVRSLKRKLWLEGEMDPGCELHRPIEDSLLRRLNEQSRPAMRLYYVAKLKREALSRAPTSDV
jgi:hypothetical protein